MAKKKEIEKLTPPSVVITDKTSGEQLIFTAYEASGTFQIGNHIVSSSPDEILDAIKELNEKVIIHKTERARLDNEIAEKMKASAKKPKKKSNRSKPKPKNGE